MENWQLDDVIEHYQPLSDPYFPHHSQPSSSSSSHRSVRSIETPSDYPSFLLDNMVSSSSSYMSSNPFIQETPAHHFSTVEAHSQLRSIKDAAMAKAMLAVLSSSSPSSSSSYHSQIPTHQHQPNYNRHQTAFKTYGSATEGPVFRRRNESCGQSQMKRLFSFLRMTRNQMQEQAHPTCNQVHHMISERKRREKLNEGFLELKALLPPGCKKDKASVLYNTRKYMGVLNAQVLELQKKNQALETRINLADQKEANYKLDAGCGGVGGDRAVVEVVGVSQSSSEEPRRFELRVIAREGDCDMIDLLIGLLECLRKMHDVSLELIHANTQLDQKNHFNRAILTIKIKTSYWDQESFKKAVNRAIGDVPGGRRSLS